LPTRTLFLDVSSAALWRAAAREVHRTFSEFASVSLAERLRASSSLARLILDPLALDAATYHTIVFIPDGALHYVPFAALQITRPKVPPRFLVAEMDVAVAPALHVLLAGADGHEESAGTRMLLVADPVYEPTDPRFSKARLDAPAPEATGVLKLLGARQLSRPPRLQGSGAEARAIAS
jgi:CHAT domain-containing protein